MMLVDEWMIWQPNVANSALLLLLVRLYTVWIVLCWLLCCCLFAGSAEGFSLAEKAISSASKSGRWVLLKNVHLAPQWLVQLEKKLHSLVPHADFRLFLTMEINPKVCGVCMDY